VRESVRSKVRRILADGRWHSGLELARRCRTVYATGMMSYVRKLRLEEHGGHSIDRVYDPQASRRTGRQVHRYRMRKKAG
jgi:hypothetical protein